MIWGISCRQFCKKSADHKEGNTYSEVPKEFLFCCTKYKHKKCRQKQIF